MTPPLQPYTPTTLVFFGSGPVAAASLALLIADGFEIEAVITKAVPEHHRGTFPVLELAKTAHLKVYTPNGKQELSELFQNKPVQSSLGIVIDYGFIINQDVINYFPLGIVNSHFSLLPEWRGADPITFSILSGQTETGVSLMLITKGMDEGPLLAQQAVMMPPDATTPELTDLLIRLSHAMLKDNLKKYISGELQPFPQPTESIPPTYSRKLTKEDGILDFSKPAEQLEREIRAFIEWPKSRMTLAGKDVVITKAYAVPYNGPVGTVEVVDNELRVYCDKGYLGIERLKPAGKNEMTAEAFLAGHKHLL